MFQTKPFVVPLQRIYFSESGILVFLTEVMAVWSKTCILWHTNILRSFYLYINFFASQVYMGDLVSRNQFYTVWKVAVCSQKTAMAICAHPRLFLRKLELRMPCSRITLEYSFLFIFLLFKLAIFNDVR